MKLQRAGHGSLDQAHSLLLCTFSVMASQLHSLIKAPAGLSVKGSGAALVYSKAQIILVKSIHRDSKATIVQQLETLADGSKLQEHMSKFKLNEEKYS